MGLLLSFGRFGEEDGGLAVLTFRPAFDFLTSDKVEFDDGMVDAKYFLMAIAENVHRFAFY